jgi:hypothetical protein
MLGVSEKTRVDLNAEFHYFCQILTHLGMRREIITKFPNIRFYRIPFTDTTVIL